MYQNAPASAHRPTTNSKITNHMGNGLKAEFSLKWTSKTDLL